jgi:hypothetical protein
MIVFTVPTERFVSCAISRQVTLIIQDQAFHALNVHRNDCCGLGTTTDGIVTDGRTAIFETLTPFRCLAAAEHLAHICKVINSVWKKEDLPEQWKE